MAQLLTDKKKLVVIHTNGPIMLLGGITGPVLSPNWVSLRLIVNMVHAGLAVYEVNPANYDETVRLTVQNVNLDNFAGSTKTVKSDLLTAAEENVPVVHEETPVVSEEVKEEKKEEAAPEKVDVAAEAPATESDGKKETQTQAQKKNDFKKR